MKRILFMHQASTVGGGSYCLLNIIKELDKSEYEPVVALKDEGSLAEELRKLGIEVVFFREMCPVPYNCALLRINSIRAYCKVKRSVSRFKELLERVEADVLYLNNMMIYPYLKPAKEQGLKTIVHIREHWPLNEHTKQLEWARNSIYQYADALIAINKYSASIFPKRDVTIVYDWIDMEGRYTYLPLDELFGKDVSQKKVLLYTGGLQQIKGADYVIDTFSQYVKGDEYRLLLLGADLSKPLSGWKHKIKCFMALFGREYYERDLRRRIQQDSRIKCCAGIYELVHLVEQSFCFVSYFRMPHANLALAENIILGNPSIAADTEEAREYSSDGMYAMLVEPNRPQEFAKSLIVFLNSNNEWRSKALSGVIPTKELFDKSINLHRLKKVLDSLSN